MKEQTLSMMVRQPEYALRFKEILKDRADQFISSLIQIGNSMPDVEPRSVMAAAMTAAALDLPINKNLGFAWIVPYLDGKRGRKLAQFQMGFKGYIQLGLRTGQYQRMNARLINKEAFVGYDDIGEPIIDWSKLDETQEPIGYAFAWRLINGFSKLCYWPKEKVSSHANRYSQAFRKKSGPWATHPHEMALKTVIKNELAKWGILSVQMEQAYRADTAVQVEPDAKLEYFENENDLDAADEKQALGNAETKEEVAASTLGSAQAQSELSEGKNVEVANVANVSSGHANSSGAAKPESGGRAPLPSQQSNAGDVSKQTEPVNSPADAPALPKTRKRSTLSFTQTAAEVSPQNVIATECQKRGISFDQFRTWATNAQDIADADSWAEWSEIPTAKAALWLKAGNALYDEVAQ